MNKWNVAYRLKKKKNIRRTLASQFGCALKWAPKESQTHDRAIVCGEKCTEKRPNQTEQHCVLPCFRFRAAVSTVQLINFQISIVFGYEQCGCVYLSAWKRVHTLFLIESISNFPFANLKPRQQLENR